MKKFLLFTTFFVYFLSVNAQCLSGTYTIGGNSPSYPTIKAAVGALQKNGICGPVVFNIRKGVYEEQIRIPSVKGNSAVNKITFQSEALDSSSVIIQYKPYLFSLNYTIAVDTTDYITFNKLNLKVLNYTDGVVLLFRNSTKNCTITGCNFSGSPGYPVTLLSFSTGCDSALIQDNKFVGGLRGIMFFSSKNMRIINNRFEDQTEYSLYGQGPALFYTGNKFTYAAELKGSAIYMAGGTFGGTISKNFIYFKEGINSNFLQIGINIIPNGGTVTLLTISNNLISIPGGVAISITNASNINLIHNSIYQIKGISVNFLNPVTGSFKNMFIQNNIFYNRYGICYSAANLDTANFKSNYNCFYSSSNPLIRYGSKNYFSLKDFSLDTKKDLKSVFADPLFYSSSNLHCYGFAPNNKGLYSSLVSDDYDSQARNKSTPDMGADEFSLKKNDAGLAQQMTTSCSGTTPIQLKLSNNGLDTLSNVVINWQINNQLQTAYNWSGKLSPGAESIITIGNYNFQPTITPYKLGAWITTSNGLPDQLTFNDTVTQDIGVRLSGTYTIGGTAPTFPTITEAVSSLNINGVCGPVTFKIRDGIYIEAVKLNHIKGSSKTNKITFESESINNPDVEWRYKNNSIVQLDSTYYVRFERIRFASQPNSPLSSCIELTRGASYNEIVNCVFMKNAENPIAMYGASSGWAYNYNLIENNLFIETGGIKLTNFAAALNIGNIIRNNTFKNPIRTAIYIDRESKPQVIGNKITRDTALELVSEYTLIIIKNAGDTVILTKNTLINKHPKVGILFVSDSRHAFVSNNYFYTEGGNSIDEAVDIAVTGNASFSNNTVKIYGASSSFGGVTQAVNYTQYNNNYYWGLKDGYILLLKNYVGKNNNYYSKDSVVFSYDSKTYNSLSKFQLATANELNSVAFDPKFYSPMSYWVGNTKLDNLGSVVNAVKDDINGTIRSNTTPDIGCYEFTSKNYDAGISKINSSNINCSGSNVVFITLKNFGKLAITTASIGWAVNGVAQNPYAYNGSLASGDSVTGINLGAFNSVTAPLVKVYPITINGQADENKSNDTITNNHLDGPLNGIYTIGNQNCDFLNFTQASTKLKTNGVCGPVIFNVMTGSYDERIVFGKVKGSSSKNTITFQSYPINNQHVRIINWLHTYTDYSLKLDSSNYFSFKDLSFVDYGDNTTSSTPIYTCTISNSNNLRFQNCFFDATLSPYTNAVFLSKADSARFIDNDFINFSTGIFSAQSGNNARSCIIEKNRFQNNYIPLNLSNIDLLEVKENKLNAINNSVSINKLSISNCKGLSFQKNKVFPYVETSFQYLDNFNTTPTLITNNFFSGYTSFTYCNAVNFIHNSIVADSFAHYNQEVALSIENGTKMVFMNNTVSYMNSYKSIYDIKGALKITNYTNGAFSFARFNNNNYYCATTNKVIYVNQYSPSTLNEWINWSHLDSNSVNINPQHISLTDLHIQNALLAGKGTNMGILTDIDNETRNTSPSIGADEFSSTLTSVWPGDADNNLSANNFDLLPIGIHYGQTGTSRAQVSNVWQANASTNWAMLQANGSDIKHVDCNGDGVINSNDTLAIHLNFGLIHPKSPAPHLMGLPEIYIKTALSTYRPGDWVDAEIWVGDNATSLQDFYGIAFNINYDAALIESGTAYLTYPNDWFTEAGKTMLHISKTDDASNTAFGALTRTNHLAKNGYGRIANLRFKIKSTIVTATSMNLSFSKYMANDAAGLNLSLNTSSHPINITPLISQIETSEKGAPELFVYPNPYSDYTTIDYTIAEKTDVRIDVYDVMGKLVQSIVNDTQPAGRYTYHFAAKEIGGTTGIYFIRIRLNDKYLVRKIVEQD